MATNQLGLGTQNVAVNLLREERDHIARLAFQRNLSLSDFIRQTLTASLEQSHPREAAALKQIRERRRAQRLKISIRVARPATVEVA